MDECSIVPVKKGTRFVTAREELTKVWILIDGDVNVLEEYRAGLVYIFQENKSPSIFGEMELIANMDFYMASLIAKTECLMITLPVKSYLNYLKNNPQLLFERAQINLKILLEAEHNNRIYLHLKSIDRMKLYFMKYYEINGTDEICILRVTHQQIADETGYSVKTVLRSISKLKEQGYLTVQGQKIKIAKQQYKKMFSSIQDITGH